MDLINYNYNTKLHMADTIHGLKKTTSGPSVLLFGILDNSSKIILEDNTFSFELNNNLLFSISDTKITFLSELIVKNCIFNNIDTNLIICNNIITNNYYVNNINFNNLYANSLLVPSLTILNDCNFNIINTNNIKCDIINNVNTIITNNISSPIIKLGNYNSKIYLYNTTEKTCKK